MPDDDGEVARVTTEQKITITKAWQEEAAALDPDPDTKRDAIEAARVEIQKETLLLKQQSEELQKVC